MTPGERAIWAAAYVDELREARKEAAVNVQVGLPSVRVDPYARAAIMAGRAVQAARRALTTLVDMPIDEKWLEERSQEIGMLRDMINAPEVKLR